MTVVEEGKREGKGERERDLLYLNKNGNGSLGLLKFLHTHGTEMLRERLQGLQPTETDASSDDISIIN